MRKANAFVGFVVVLVWILGFLGWCLNIVKLSHCDFEKPFNAEVIRIVGIPVAPAGAIVGWMDIGK